MSGYTHNDWEVFRGDDLEGEEGRASLKLKTLKAKDTDQKNVVVEVYKLKEGKGSRETSPPTLSSSSEVVFVQRYLLVAPLVEANKEIFPSSS
jgi:hypothetical protein